MNHGERARQMARDYLRQGRFLEWFEDLYASSAGDASAIPWAGRGPNPLLVEWMAAAGPPAPGSRALVVGCGLGDDAEFLAAAGLAVTAFDLAPSAVAWCRRRFPDSRVDYLVADLLNPPPHWRRRFDLVFEAYTLQSLPAAMLERAIARIADFVARDGRLLVITRARDEAEPADGPPWPLTRGTLSGFLRHGLCELAVEERIDGGEEPPVRRLRAVYTRSGPA